ncbi:MAG: hypothetical protein KatS3mg060_3595 [Dehalococcoidia bacterium]|nr:MAG: hypothetical protein KatS3mg060_3595 [Dehalococcoidia bacterium]
MAAGGGAGSIGCDGRRQLRPVGRVGAPRASRFSAAAGVNSLPLSVVNWPSALADVPARLTSARDSGKVVPAGRSARDAATVTGPHVPAGLSRQGH